MDLTLSPRPLKGEITVIPSKSQAHRLLICAAFADSPTDLICPDTNRDIEATVDCLNALGATITRTDSGYFVIPMESAPDTAVDAVIAGAELTLAEKFLVADEPQLTAHSLHFLPKW